jgi:hypothetical protein
VQKISLTIIALALLGACSKAPSELPVGPTGPEEISSLSASIDQGSRHYGGEQLRDQKFRIITGRNHEMGLRLIAAEAIYKSYNGDLLDVLTEFTARLEEIYHRIDVRRMSPLGRGKKSDMEKGFYALSAKLDVGLLAEGRGARVVSFYSIMKTALVKEIRGEDFLPFEETLIVGPNKEMVLELIKARVDIFSAMALELLTDGRDMNLTQRAKRSIFQITGGRYGGIDLPEVYSTANETTKKEIESLLNSAVEARDFLAQIGVTKDLERNLLSAFSHIDFQMPSGPNPVSEEPAQVRIKDLIKRLL